MIRQLVCGALLASSVVFASGCLVMRGSSTGESGVQITEPTLQQIKPGETTEAWLVAAAGEPTSRRSVDERTSILRYDHTVTTASGGAVFLLFAGGDEEHTTTSTLFEVTDGVVTRFWTEN